MAKPLIPPTLTPDGYPGFLVIVDATTGRPLLLTYNSTSDAWENPDLNDGLTLESDGGNWVVKDGGTEISSGPLDSLSPVGSYTGAVSQVGAVAPTGGVTTPVASLSPGAPGALIP